jgi:hypothetical protein
MSYHTEPETMQETEVIFGHMTHGQFLIGNDAEPMVIINRIEERKFMNPAEADDFMTEQGHDSYLVPSEFNGQIVYSIDFINKLQS